MAAAFFLAVLGRTSELTATEHPENGDGDTAGLMLAILDRALLRRPDLAALPPESADGS